MQEWNFDISDKKDLLESHLRAYQYLSMRLSILFFRSEVCAGKRSCVSSSAISWVCSSRLRAFIVRTIAASTWPIQYELSLTKIGHSEDSNCSTWYSLSLKTSSWVFSFSSAVSFNCWEVSMSGQVRSGQGSQRGGSLTWMVLILMRKSLLEKSSLKRKQSPSRTSLPRGSFSSTRVPICPFARDCRVRRSSPSSIPVAALHTEHYQYHQYHEGLRTASK